MIKETLEFIAAYPTWVKVSVVMLTAAIGLLLLIYRPTKAEDDAVKKAESIHVFRIERLESGEEIKDISLTISINGQIQKFPATYQSAIYEQNMLGGEYVLPASADEFIIEIRALVRTEEVPPGGVEPVRMTLDLQLRQPTRLRRGEFPKRGVETLRVIEDSIAQSPYRRNQNILVHYSVT
jgi:hypothetical protein